ncbi:MAG: hypothetical protein OER90_20715 [Gemmatimonadota bacterium]|nr:hypothetical protein [Gemmatimonadota bacterium]
MRFVLAASLALLALTTAPSQASGQSTTTPLIAPSMDGVAATIRLHAVESLSLQTAQPFGMAVTVQSRRDKRQGEILMIVGAAGIVTGLLVEESLVTIAGAAVGGFGLYLYLRATR